MIIAQFILLSKKNTVQQLPINVHCKTELILELWREHYATSSSTILLNTCLTKAVTQQIDEENREKIWRKKL